MRIKSTVCGIFWFLLLSSVAKGAVPNSPVIDSLLSQMSVEEKVGQLIQYSADMGSTGSTVLESYQKEITLGRVGSVFNAYTPEFTRKLQRMAIENTRMKIPLIFGYDVIHGHKTIFPISLGESSSWDLKLMEKTASISALEARADGLHWTFAPMVDVSRDPRWGRISEGAGEDPWLGSQIATARVHGVQSQGVLACVKHFAAYGAAMGGRDYNTVDISERELFETYLPPYHAAIKAGAASVMTSFNEIAGMPSTANRWLLTDLLRKLWKFEGFIVTDYTAINELVPHGIAENEKHAALQAFKAGVDMDMQGGTFMKYIPALIREGKIKVSELDLAVRRVLSAKERLGLFKNPLGDLPSQSVIFSDAHLEHAREIARKSIVLLKNQNNVLPLRSTSTIALIGPMAENQRDQIGSWSAAGDWRQVVSLREGLARAIGSQAKILYAKGANLLEEKKLLGFLNQHGGDIASDPRAPAEMIREAVSIARESDVVVLALGETQGMSGEAASRTRIRLPENQQALLRALAETGKPIALVLFNGRPLVLTEENQYASAIVEAWFLGSQAGTAIADVLLGNTNPSGKLTVSFPYHEGQIPIFYGAKNTGRPQDANNKYTSKYLDAPNEPLFPFGWGLSYTTFEYSDVKLSSVEISSRDRLKVSVTVTNSGAVDGEETVQLYLRDMVASVTRPIKQLRGFKKIFLRKSESQEVTFELTPEDLKFYDQRMRWVAEPGQFKVMVGGNSAELKDAYFTLK